jgi:hypothetical protein
MAANNRYGNSRTDLVLKGRATATWDPGSVASKDTVGNSFVATTVTVTGAALGDLVLVSFSLDVTDLVLTADVTAADTITVVLSNPTSGAVDLASGTLTVVVIDQNTGL